MTAKKVIKKPISVTLDAEVLDELQKLIEAGEASSLSSVINETLRSRIERRRQARQAREYIEEHLLGGDRLSDPEVVEARNRLEVAATHLPAFRRAMQRADAAQRERQTADGGTSTVPVPSSQEVTGAQAYVVPPLPALKPVAADDPTYVRLPNGVMVRIFFAAGGE